MSATRDFSFALAPSAFPQDTLPTELGVLTITSNKEETFKGTIRYLPGRWREGQGVQRADLEVEVSGVASRFGPEAFWTFRIYFTLGEDRDGMYCGWTTDNRQIKAQVNRLVLANQTTAPSESKLAEEAMRMAKLMGIWIGAHHPTLWADATTLWCLHEAYEMKTLIDKSYNPKMQAMLVRDQVEWYQRAVKSINRPFMAKLLTHPSKDIRLWLTKVWQEHATKIEEEIKAEAEEEAKAAARRAARKA